MKRVKIPAEKRKEYRTAKRRARQLDTCPSLEEVNGGALGEGGTMTAHEVSAPEPVAPDPVTTRLAKARARQNKRLAKAEVAPEVAEVNVLPADFTAADLPDLPPLPPTQTAAEMLDTAEHGARLDAAEALGRTDHPKHPDYWGMVYRLTADGRTPEEVGAAVKARWPRNWKSSAVTSAIMAAAVLAEKGMVHHA